MSDHPDEESDENELPLPETTNLTDPKSQRRARDKIKRDRQEAESFWRAVFNDRIGRREIWRLLEAANTFDTPFMTGPNGFPNEAASWWREGQREFGLRLYHSLLTLDREGALRMQDEHDPRFIKTKPRRRTV